MCLCMTHTSVVIPMLILFGYIIWICCMHLNLVYLCASVAHVFVCVSVANFRQLLISEQINAKLQTKQQFQA